MADVTISQLSQGTPSGNSILPYSTGSNTLGVPVSAIFQNVDKIGLNTALGAVPYGNFNIGCNLGIPTNVSPNPDNAIILGLVNKDYSGTTGDARVLDIGATQGGGAFIRCLANTNKTGYLNFYADRVGVYAGWPGGQSTPIPQSRLHVDGVITATGLNVPGTILNVVQAVYNDESDVGTGPQGAGNSWSDVPGLTVSITPKFTTSKFMLRANIHSGFNATTTCNFRFMKNGSPIGVGKAGTAANGTTPDDLGSFRGSTPNPSWCNPAMGEFLDTSANTGAAITYKVQFKPYYFDNRTLRWNNSIAGGGGDRVRVISTLTVTEIAG